MRWADQSGWDLMFAQAAGVPGLYPAFLTAQFDIPGADSFTEPGVSRTATIVNSPDSEFWIVGANIGGWSDPDVAQATQEGIGGILQESPDFYTATILVREGSAGRTLSAGPVNVGHLCGGGPRPYLWPCPWKVLPGTELQITINQRDTVSYGVWLTFIGFKRFLDAPPVPTDFLLTPTLVRLLSKYRASGQNVVPVPYWYPMAFAGNQGRAPQATEQQTVSVTEADFALCHLAAFVSDPEDGTGWFNANTIDDNAHQSTVAPPFPGRGMALETIRLVTGLGRIKLDDRPVILGNLFGTGRKIGRYPYPLLIPKNDSLTALVKFADSSTGENAPLRCDLTFGGARLVAP